jgi:hypothetical protein
MSSDKRGELGETSKAAAPELAIGMLLWDRGSMILSQGVSSSLESHSYVSQPTRRWKRVMTRSLEALVNMEARTTIVNGETAVASWQRRGNIAVCTRTEQITTRY